MRFSECAGAEKSKLISLGPGRAADSLLRRIIFMHGHKTCTPPRTPNRRLDKNKGCCTSGNRYISAAAGNFQEIPVTDILDISTRTAAFVFSTIMDSPDISTKGGITAIANGWITQFANAAASGDVKCILTLFLSVGWLRDTLVFTWTHRSLCGHDAIIDYLANRLGPAGLRNFELDEDHSIEPNYDPKLRMIEAALTFETPVAYGRGLVRLLQDKDGSWKAFTLFLTLDDLKGHEEKVFESGYYDGHTRTWNEVHEEEKARIESDPHVIISGCLQQLNTTF